MTESVSKNNMATIEQSQAPWPILRRAARAVVVVDVVESVRLMEQNEEDTVRRWQAFVGGAVTTLLPPHGGRLVESRGDGLVMEFAGVVPAVQCTLAMQSQIAAANQHRPPAEWLRLRQGVHVGDVFADEHDIHGRTVNLAARLMTLAGPDEIVVSADVRDQLVPGLDAQVEDLGECYVKHLQQPIRAYRVGPPGDHPLVFEASRVRDPVPVIAVLPMRVVPPNPSLAHVGDIVADDIIAKLATTTQWKVISRLSSAAFRDRQSAPSEAFKHLGAAFVLSGHCHVVGDKLRLIAELADTRSETVVWSGSVSGRIGDLIDPDGELAATVASHVGSAIFSHELGRARGMPMPTLESHTLLFAAIGLMHRLSRETFEQSRAMLEHLVERHPLAPAPKAWLGKWYVMKVAQGWSNDLAADGRLAQAWVNRALQQQPDHALGLAIDGLISGYLFKQLDKSEELNRAALAANPHEPLAWLFSSALHGYRQRGDMAATAATRALSLSPLDPMKYYFDSFATHAMLTAGRYEEAIRLGKRSLMANCQHQPTLRTLAMAQALGGHVDDAKRSIQRLLTIEPSYTVDLYRTRHPGGNTENCRLYADALRQAGLPES